MPKISSSTISNLEKTEGLNTRDFRVGRHKEKPIDLSSLEPDILSVLSFRARKAIERQEQENRIPSEIDQAAAEIFGLLQDGEKSLNDLSPKQVGQVYFILRDSEKNKDYLDWVTEGLKGKKRRKAKEKEKKVIRRLTRKLERKLTGQTIGESLREINILDSYSPRDKLRLDYLLKKYHGKGKFEKAMADFSGQEIEKVLQKSGEIDEERISKAKEATSPKERRFAQIAERLPGLIEKAMKKRKEISGWTTAEQFRDFMGVTEQDLSDSDLIIFILENNPDLIKDFLTSHRYRAKTLLDLKNLFRRNPDVNRKSRANKLVEEMVTKHSFNTVIDTMIQIVDANLPEAEEALGEQIKQPEITSEAANKMGSAEISLMIGEGLTDEQITAKGIPEDKIQEIKRNYFYKENGQWKLKKATDDENRIKEEKEEKLRAIASQLDEDEIKVKVDELLEEQAKKDFLQLKRGELTDESNNVIDYKAEIVRIYNQNKATLGWTIPIQNFNEITRSEVPKVKELWWKEKEMSYIADSEKREAQRLAALEQVLEKHSDIKAKYEQSLELINVDKLIAEIGAPALTILRGKGKIDDGWDKIRFKIGDMGEILDDGETALRSSEEITQKLSRENISSALWVLLITLNLVNIDKVVQELMGAGKEPQAREVQELAGVI